MHAAAVFAANEARAKPLARRGESLKSGGRGGFCAAQKLPAMLAGRMAVEPLEHHPEMPQVAEAAGGGDARERRARAGREDFFRVPQAQPGDKRARREAELLAEARLQAAARPARERQQPL